LSLVYNEIGDDVAVHIWEYVNEYKKEGKEKLKIQNIDLTMN
jgi:hypothetical protein